MRNLILRPPSPAGFDKQAIYRALQVIEAESDLCEEAANAVAVIRCETRKHQDPAELVKAERTRVMAIVTEICEEPEWVDGVGILERVREGI